MRAFSSLSLQSRFPDGSSGPHWFTTHLCRVLLAATWVGLLGARLLLLGRGALADYDERRYFESFAAVRALARADWPAFAHALSSTAARPVDALWRCLPAAAQLALARCAGWDMYAYPSLLIPTALNWLTTVLAAWYFLGICRQLLAGAAAAREWALVAAILYASLANTSLYVRHVVPYDGALLLLLALMFWVLRQPVPPRAGWFWFRLGLGAGALLLFYPGYYAGPALLLAPLLNWRRPFAWAFRFRWQLLALGGGFCLPLLAAEGLSRLGHAPPYWAVSYDLSRHVLQGDPAEGYSFLFRYLWQVENGLGILLLALLALATGQAGWHWRWAALGEIMPRTARQKVLSAALLLFLTHCTAAAVGRSIVWYGRLLHLYLPWLVLAGVAGLAVARQRWAAGAGLAACVVGVVSYGAFFRSYQRVLYPPDIIAAYSLGCRSPQQLRYYNAVPVPDKLRFPVRGPRAAQPSRCPPSTRHRDSLLVLINFADLYPPNGVSQVPLPAFGAAARILVDGPHCSSFPAYGFEGLGPAERATAARRQFRLQVLLIDRKPKPALSLRRLKS